MIHNKYTDIRDLQNTRAGEVTVRGSVRSNRSGGKTGFIDINDGTRYAGAQLVYDADLLPEAAKLQTGSAIEARGELVFTPEGRQPFEIRAHEITLVGACDTDYPMQKKRHSLEFLRELPHLRVRTNTFSAVFRVRNALIMAIHEFLQKSGFLYITTPIITGNDAEGAGEAFGVSSGGKENFFGKAASLTVSGQLHAEPFALAFDRVYTFGPTFRAENSNTTTHAAEFWMVEPEMSYSDLEDNMEVMEALVKNCITAVLERCPEEAEFFDRLIDESHTLISRLQAVSGGSFTRMTYTDAISELESAGRDFKYPVKWGLDLKTEHERFLCEEIVRGPLFLTDYPKDIKAFYMRMNDDEKTVAACDLLVPSVGELIGGSQREERYDKLTSRMSEMGISINELQWYADLRRFGSVPHSGFGLGLERFLMYLTSMKNIRDTLPYARTPGNMIF